MEPRIDFMKVGQGAINALLGVEKYVHGSGLEPTLLDLIKLRASQINGCAYCIDMHWKDLRAIGESEQRLYGLDAWRESPYYTDRERAALEWAESLTTVSENHVPDSVYDVARSQFSEKELVDLTHGVVAINGWTRIAIAARTAPGHYKPADAH